MRTAILLSALGAALALAACASTSETTDVKAVVTDEGARQAAQSVATKEADSEQALDAAGDTPKAAPETPADTPR